MIFVPNPSIRTVTLRSILPLNKNENQESSWGRKAAAGAKADLTAMYEPIV
jgi:hypothetical protein